MIWLLISGGKVQSTVFFLFFPIHLPGHGYNTAGKRKCNVFVSLFALNMITLAYVHADHVLFMKVSRFVQKLFSSFVGFFNSIILLSYHELR